MDKIIISVLVVCSILVFQVQSKKERSLPKDLLPATAHKADLSKTPAVPGSNQLQVGTSKSFLNSTHATAKAGTLSGTLSKAGHKMTPAKKIPVSGDPSSKLVSKIRHKTSTPKTTTELTTTETTTTELTTIEETTTETTTIEETTTETTTVEETTTETTTVEETTTEMTTVETTTENTTTHSARTKKPTPRLKSGPTTEGNLTTKSWQKYLKKTTSLPTATTKPNKELLMKSSEKKGPSPVPEENGPATTSATISNSGKELKMNLDEKEGLTTKGNFHGVTSPYVNTRPSEDSANQNGVRMRKTYTSSTNDDGTNESSTVPSNTSVDVKVDIDIDIKLRSSLSSTEGNSSEEYFASTTATSPVPRNREKRQQKKKVLAGVILVVLISLSAAFAVMFVLVPAKTEVRTRRYHRRPDQVELITPGRRNRPRFYDATIYMGY